MWTCYKVYLEAKSPIHIGYGAKLGIVDRTRYYIPAKNIWGALTNLIARNIMRSYNSKVYQEIGKYINENIKFSYFYPVEYKKISEKIEIIQVFAPCYTEDGLKFGVCKDKEKITSEKFEQTFISSFVSTAIDKASKSAEKESLHEIEFIRDKIELNSCVKPTVFVGYFFAKDERLKIRVGTEKSEISFTNFSIEVNGSKLNEIWIGGERNYGLGRIKILSLEKFNKDKVYIFDSGVMVDVTGEQLIVDSEDGRKTALSHVNIENLNINLILGDIEPLIGREWNEKGSGQKISQTAKICIVPGSQLVYDSIIYISNFGLWEVGK